MWGVGNPTVDSLYQGEAQSTILRQLDVHCIQPGRMAKGVHRVASIPSLNSFAKGVLGISPPISGVRTVLDELEAGWEGETTRKVSEMVVKGKPGPDVMWESSMSVCQDVLQDVCAPALIMLLRASFTVFNATAVGGGKAEG